MTESKHSFGAIVETEDGSLTVTHPDFGEEYHSRRGARFESVELYMIRSGFRDRLASAQNEIELLDVGLGLGYNALTSLEFWADCANSPDLHIVSLEINPALPEALAKGNGPWQAGWSKDWLNWATALEQTAQDRFIANIRHPKNSSQCLWTVLVGDACSAPLAEVVHKGFDYIWQDAFSPKKNPTLWTNEWFQKLAQSCANEATLVTYSVARVVKDGLTGQGWNYELIEAAGTKRHWLKAVKKS